MANGQGIRNIFKEFGADVVIDGGQTNNPASSEFIKAFDETNADVIFVLPNNSNVILTAKQAANSYKLSKIHVVESKSIGEGYAALSMLDLFVDDENQIIENMYAEMAKTTTGSITTATRTTKYNNIAITKDDYIGLVNKDIVTSNATKIRAVCDLIEKMSINKKDIIVLIYGKNFTAKERVFTSEYVKAKNPCMEVYEIDGNQDIYDLFIVLN